MRDSNAPWTRWWYDIPLKDFVKDKEQSTKSDIFYMLNRLMSMFKYEGLPETIPKKFFDYYLFVNGHGFITDVKDDLYIFVGGLGGEPDPYYRPTIYTVANPALNLSKTYKIGEDGILMRNDTMMYGLLPMLSKYCSLLAENLVTMRTADIMLRVLALITAPDDKSREAADIYLKNIVDGKLGSISENRFLDGIRMQNPPSNNGSYLTQFIELHQYLVGSFYNEVGLNANYNMKREALSESETGLNDDSLMPLCEDMLRCRREDIQKVNNLFGTSIEVDFDSSWLENTIERLLSLKQQASEASSQLDNPAPMEAGMENVGLEDADMEGVGNQGANGNEDDRMEESGRKEGTEEDGTEDSGGEEDGTPEDDNGSNDESNSEEQSNEEEGTDDSDEHDESTGGDEGDESEQGDSEEESNNENGEVDETIEDSIEAPGVEVNVEVNFMNPPEDGEEDETEDGIEDGKEESTDDAETGKTED